MINLTDVQLTELLLKAANWQLHATEDELYNMSINEAKNSVIQRLTIHAFTKCKSKDDVDYFPPSTNFESLFSYSLT